MSPTEVMLPESQKSKKRLARSRSLGVSKPPPDLSGDAASTVLAFAKCQNLTLLKIYALLNVNKITKSSQIMSSYFLKHL